MILICKTQNFTVINVDEKTWKTQLKALSTQFSKVWQDICIPLRQISETFPLVISNKALEHYKVAK